jgi:hypothetical protein
MNFKNTETQKLLFIFVVIAILFYFLNPTSTTEGYARPVMGGSYGGVQNEIYWNYPHLPTIENPSKRHAKYSVGDKVHAVSYVYPDMNATVNEAHDCVEMPCPPAFGDEDVMCYKCPQPKRFDSGR